MVKGTIKIFPVCLILFFLVSNNIYAQKEIIVKQIDFKIDHISENSYENEYFVTLKFTKGINYIFKIRNHIGDYVGEAVVEILDVDKMVTTNSVGGKYYDKIGFNCNKTAFYDVLIRYKDNKIGHSMVDIYMMQ
jgi:hypothetical protein